MLSLPNYETLPLISVPRASFSNWPIVPTMRIHVVLAYTLLFFFFVSFARYRRAVAMVSNFPGLRLFTSPMGTLGLLLPSLPMPLYTYPGFAFPWTLKHAGFFKKFKCDTVSLCAWDGRAILYTCDVPFFSRMASSVGSTLFPKPIEEYTVLSYFGDNLVIAEHSNWRRQRRVTAPAFSSRVFQRLWSDVGDIVHDMVREERWSERTEKHDASNTGNFVAGEYIPAEGEVYVPHAVDITLRMALAAIARTGFGMEFEWRSDEAITKSCAGFGGSLGWSILRIILAPIRSIINLFLPDAPYARLLRSMMADSTSLTGQPAVEQVSGFKSALRLLSSSLAHILDESDAQEGMRVQEALHLVAQESTLKLALSSLPSWLTACLPFRRVRRMNMAFDCLHEELRLMVAQRRREVVTLIEGSSSGHTLSLPAPSAASEESGSSGYTRSSFGGDVDPTEEHFDLLSNLVRSAMQTERVGAKSLTDDEIIGNAYIYLLAGHETTAHSLAWTLALLAAYPDHQDKAYQEIIENDPTEETTIRDYPKFRFLLACYHETLRLFPPVQQVPKVAAEDTQILFERSNDFPNDETFECKVDDNTGAVSISDIPISISTSSSTASTSTLLPSVSSTPSRIFGHHRRHKLPPLTVPARSISPSGSGFLFGVPSMPVTPLPSPKREQGSFNFGSSMPTTPTKSEFFGPPPFVQLNQENQTSTGSLLSPASDQTSLVVKKGTIIFISTPAVHYNPKYWSDPDTFDPERFLKPYNRSAFIPFGVGTRACLGRKFSEVESVCMLVHLLRNYSVHLPVQPGESIEDVRRKFSKASIRITLTPERVPLIFRRRVQ